MQYKIGDVSKILGISSDLIRYYEKKGVVRPEKGAENNYRYYDTWDINFLIDCLWYKSYGFGIDEIAHIESESTYDSLLGSLDAKQLEIRELAHRYRLLDERLELQKNTLAEVRGLLGKCEVVDGPEFIYYLNRHNFEYENDKALEGLSRRWVKYMPFSTRYFEFAKTPDSHESDYSWGFSLDMKYVKEFGITYEPPVRKTESVKCVHSAFKSSGKNAFSPKHMDFMYKYAKTAGLTPCGAAHGTLVCSVLDNNRLTGFFQSWLPVCENRE